MRKSKSPGPGGEFEGFLLRSQHRAALAMSAFCGLLVVIQVVFIFTVLQPLALAPEFHGLRLFLLPLLVGTLALIELGYARSLHARFHSDRPPLRILPFALAAGEALLPTIGIILFRFATDWPTALHSPPVSGYYVILLLSILRMDVRICLFVGGIEAASLLALIAVAADSASIAFPLGNVVLILVTSVIAAGIVRVTRGLVTDLIASHRAEAEASRAQAQAEAVIWQKDRLLAILGHDLRTPLNGISTLSELMARVPEQFSAAEIRDHAGEIQQISRHLRELLDNLLAWARLRNSQLQRSPASYSAAELVEPVLALTESAFSAKSISLSHRLTGQAVTDRELSQTILRNLLSNALKFTPNGGTVTVAASASDEPGGFTLNVTDSGPGLSMEIAGKAHEGSVVASTPGTEGEAGSGLGLALCYELARHLGGTLEFVSGSEGGTTATLRLPVNPLSEIRV